MSNIGSDDTPEPASASSVRGQPSLFEATSGPFPLPLAADIMSAEHWSLADIPCDDPTFSVGSWLRTAAGKVAFRKPGVARPGGSSEAFREFVSYQLARWLTLPVPTIELLIDGELGPCCLSMAAGRGFILKPNNFKLLPEVRQKAVTALQTYVAIVVLDVLVGAMDRENPGNHLYVALDDRWYSIDYSCSFNLFRKIRGVGDPTAPYTAEYFPAFFTALTLNPDAIPTTLNFVEQIPDEAIRRLVSLPPAEFV